MRWIGSTVIRSSQATPSMGNMGDRSGEPGNRTLQFSEVAIVGVAGLVVSTVNSRRREIGVRVALGATRFATVWLVFRDALIMTTSGIAIALPGVWALGKFVESQLYDVKPTDPATIVAATLLLCSTSLGAALIPAYRASTVNPADSLRLE